MKKFKLFAEYRNLELYGDTAQEALSSIALLPRADKYIPPELSGKMYGYKQICGYEPQDDILISKIMGIEDTSTTRRGDKEIIRLIAETSEGIIAIDVMECYTRISII